MWCGWDVCDGWWDEYGAMGWVETNIDRQTDGHIGKEERRHERKNNEEDWKGHLRLNWESIENLIMSFFIWEMR